MRALLNHLIGAQNPADGRGHVTYFTPVNPGGRRAVGPAWRGGSWSIRIRIPAWTPGATIAVNGQAQDVSVTPGSYARSAGPGQRVTQAVADHDGRYRRDNHVHHTYEPTCHADPSTQVAKGRIVFPHPTSRWSR